MRARAKKDIVRILFKDGELHFVLREQTADEEPRECIRLKDAEVESLLKREASKPLLLLRAE